MVRNFRRTWIMFCSVLFCKIMVFKYFSIVLLYFYLISSFLHTKGLFIPYAYVSIKSIDCIALSSFVLKAILLISSLKTLHLSLLNFAVFSILSISYIIFFEFFKAIYISYIFSFFFVLFSIWAVSKQFCIAIKCTFSFHYTFFSVFRFFILVIIVF